MRLIFCYMRFGKNEWDNLMPLWVHTSLSSVNNKDTRAVSIEVVLASLQSTLNLRIRSKYGKIQTRKKLLYAQS